MVLLTLELVGNNIFAWQSATVHPASIQNFVAKHVFAMRENSELFRLSLKALFSVEKPVSVEDGHLRSAPEEGGR